MINLGRSIGEGLKPGDVVAFEAPLGAGKTTLTKGIAQALEVEEEITSPTFTIISEYPGKIPLFHMDFYRITQEEDLETLGVEEFFYREGVSVVEWSGIAASILPESTLRIRIALEGETTRRVTCGGSR